LTAYRLPCRTGSVGNLFYSYASYSRSTAGNIEWAVFDLPKTVQAGVKIAAERGKRGLHFTTSLTEVEGEYVILVSSAFHYLGEKRH